MVLDYLKGVLIHNESQLVGEKRERVAAPVLVQETGAAVIAELNLSV